ncbi:MAG TPA: class I SAM-dependent methyltransferase [Herpetosiphonaceae bacterium]|nr:class I SAM-dependent methyltransferase [Herpetosiphonaceae bacterium]
MDRVKFSTIAHQDHRFANPLGEAKVDHMLSLLDLEAGAPVLDVGCGNAELLIRLIKRFDAIGVGVDPNGAMLDRARERAAALVISGRLVLHERTIDGFVPEQPLAAALCVGSTHAYGGYEETLAALARIVRPGGLIMVGEGYWKREPDPAYLELLGAAPDELTSHAANVGRARALGLMPLYSAVSSDDDWDHYEGLYSRAMQRYAAAHPDDPDSPEFAAHSSRWYDGYLRWGRDTLGFGLYLFQVAGG